MRAFGHGSLSSFLKTGLDVVVWALVAVLALTTAALAATLLAQPFVGSGEPRGAFAAVARLIRRGPVVSGFLAVADVYGAALLAVADRLRRVFATLIAGRPFEPRNVRRLQEIGLSLLVLELAGYALAMLAPAALGAPRRTGGDGANLSGWFAVLVVFVLAEVFREGARLQAEAELTV